MTIITGSNSGVAFDTSAINETLIVAPGATAGALQTTFTGSLLINYGNLSGLNGGVAFDVTASGQFINKPGGSVEGALGVFIKGAGDVLNQGVILGATQHGISVQSSANHNHIVNSGDVYGFLGGITVSAGSAIDVSISNSGEIRADLNGIWLLNATGAAPVVVNSGTVIGRVNAILAEGGDRLNLTNSGLLSGDVVATSAGLSDLVANNGTVAGNVKLGTGNDFYHGSGTVSGTVFGEDGLDNLFGGKSADRLDGGSGNDHLGGGLGRDTLTGGANNDFFVFDTAPNTSANRDSVTDFNHANDTFQLDNAVFKALGGTGALKASFFFAGAAAHDADDHIIYNRATGVLTYDSNGNAAGGAVQFAVLTTLKPVLAADDFVVI